MRSPEIVDVRWNLAAKRLLRDLATRGITLAVRSGNLVTSEAAAAHLSAADLAALRQHKADVLVLLLLGDVRCQTRLADLRAKGVVLQPVQPDRGCYVCGEDLPGHRRHGRCGWCALAVRLFDGAAVPASVIDLFDESIRGARQGALLEVSA